MEFSNLLDHLDALLSCPSTNGGSMSAKQKLGRSTGQAVFCGNTEGVTDISIPSSEIKLLSSRKRENKLKKEFINISKENDDKSSQLSANSIRLFRRVFDCFILLNTKRLITLI